MSRPELPQLLSFDEAAAVLKATRAGDYAIAERDPLPDVVEIGL